MSEETTLTAIVLRRWDSGESDRRISILTRERGRINVVAKGARKSGSRLAAASEPTSLVTLQLASGKRQGFITQAQIHPGFPLLRRDFVRLQSALGFLELVAAVTPLDRPDDGVFDLAVRVLTQLESHAYPGIVLVWAQSRLMIEEGLHPNWIECGISGEALSENPAWISPTAGGYIIASQAVEYMDRFTAKAETLIGLAKVAELESPPARMREWEGCLEVLLRFWQYHIGRDLPANEAVLQEVRESSRQGEFPVS